MSELLIHDLPQLILVGFGLYIVARSIGATFSPRDRGTVIGFDATPACCGQDAASVIGVAVKLADGSLARAEMSPCAVCVDRVTKGDTVSLTRCGGRLIAQKAVSRCR